jgi:hypothetical protein
MDAMDAMETTAMDAMDAMRAIAMDAMDAMHVVAMDALWPPACNVNPQKPQACEGNSAKATGMPWEFVTVRGRHAWTSGRCGRYGSLSRVVLILSGHY